MNSKVAYFTKTGHSEKIAKAIGKELQLEVEDLKAKPVFQDVDLLFLVGGIYAGGNDPEMVGCVENIDPKMVKKTALVTSCASKRMKQDKVRKALEKNNIEVLPDEFICRGNFLFLGMGHPNQADLDNAVAFASNVIKNNQ